MRRKPSLLVLLLTTVGLGACCSFQQLFEPAPYWIHFQDYFFVTSAQMRQILSEEPGLINNPKEHSRIVSQGHRILPGSHMVLLFRNFSYIPWASHSDRFEKLTIEIASKEVPHEIMVPSNHVRIFYSELAGEGAGNYSTTATGKITITPMTSEKEWLSVTLDLRFKFDHSYSGPEGSGLKSLKGTYRLREKEVGSLDNWLGGERLSPSEAYEIKEPLEVYIRKLESDRPDMRYLAAYQLRHFTEAAAVQALLSALKREKDTRVRESILLALPRNGHPSLVPVFLEALKDCDRSIRITAIGGLQTSGDASVIPALREVALNDRNGYVRQLAQQTINSLEKK